MFQRQNRKQPQSNIHFTMYHKYVHEYVCHTPYERLQVHCYSLTLGTPIKTTVSYKTKTATETLPYLQPVVYVGTAVRLQAFNVLLCPAYRGGGVPHDAQLVCRGREADDVEGVAVVEVRQDVVHCSLDLECIRSDRWLSFNVQYR